MGPMSHICAVLLQAKPAVIHTGISVLFLLYGREPRLPIEDILSPLKMKALINLKEYGCDLATKMSEAWDVARRCIGKV